MIKKILMVVGLFIVYLYICMLPACSHLIINSQDNNELERQVERDRENRIQPPYPNVRDK